MKMRNKKPFCLGKKKKGKKERNKASIENRVKFNKGVPLFSMWARTNVRRACFEVNSSDKTKWHYRLVLQPSCSKIYAG